MTASYRPLRVALGVIALYLLLVVLVSSWLRRRIGYGVWRKLHALTFVIFALAFLHGVLSGSNSGMPWALGLYLGTGAVVILLAAHRFLGEGGATAERRRGASSRRA